MDDTRRGRVTAPALRTSRGQAATAVVGIASAAIVVLRLALADNSLHVLWAEDGAVFLQDALRHPLSSLTSSYAGYGLVIGRVLAQLGHVVPIEDWPALTNITSALVVGVTSAVVFRAAWSLDLVATACVVGALVPAFLPGQGFEVLGVWANLQWVLAYGLAWVLVVPPDRSTRVMPAVFGGIALGAGAAGLFVCPLLLLHGRRWYRHPALPGFAIGALYHLLVQFTPSVSNVYERSSGAPSIRTLVEFPARALVESGGGPLGNRSFVTTFGVLVLVVAIVTIACSPARRSGLALIGCAYLALVTLTILNFGFVAPRYASLTASLVVAAVLICVGGREHSRRWLTWVLALACGAWLLALPVSSARASGPHWSHSVERARARCAADAVTGSTIVHLPVGPTGWGSAALPCDVID